MRADRHEEGTHRVDLRTPAQVAAALIRAERHDRQAVGRGRQKLRRRTVVLAVGMHPLIIEHALAHVPPLRDTPGGVGQERIRAGSVDPESRHHRSRNRRGAHADRQQRAALDGQRAQRGRNREGEITGAVFAEGSVAAESGHGQGCGAGINDGVLQIVERDEVQRCRAAGRDEAAVAADRGDRQRCPSIVEGHGAAERKRVDRERAGRNVQGSGATDLLHAIEKTERDHLRAGEVDDRRIVGTVQGQGAGASNIGQDPRFGARVIDSEVARHRKAGDGQRIGDGQRAAPIEPANRQVRAGNGELRIADQGYPVPDLVAGRAEDLNRAAVVEIERAVKVRHITDRGGCHGIVKPHDATSGQGGNLNRIRGLENHSADVAVERADGHRLRPGLHGQCRVGHLDILDRQRPASGSVESARPGKPADRKGSAVIGNGEGTADTHLTEADAVVQSQRALTVHGTDHRIASQRSGQCERLAVETDVLQQDRRAGSQRACTAQHPDRIRAFAREVQRTGEFDGVNIDRTFRKHLTRTGQHIHAQRTAVGPSHTAGTRNLKDTQIGAAEPFVGQVALDRLAFGRSQNLLKDCDLGQALSAALRVEIPIVGEPPDGQARRGGVGSDQRY